MKLISGKSSLLSISHTQTQCGSKSYSNFLKYHSMIFKGKFVLSSRSRSYLNDGKNTIFPQKWWAMCLVSCIVSLTANQWLYFFFIVHYYGNFYVRSLWISSTWEVTTPKKRTSSPEWYGKISFHGYKLQTHIPLCQKVWAWVLSIGLFRFVSIDFKQKHLWWFLRS